MLVNVKYGIWNTIYFIILRGGILFKLYTLIKFTFLSAKLYEH